MGHGCDLVGASGSAISPVLQAAQSCKWLVRSRKWLGAISPVLGCDETGAIWGCVRDLVGSTLSSRSRVWYFFFFFFFFLSSGNGLKVSLEMGFDRGAARSRLAGAWLR